MAKPNYEKSSAQLDLEARQKDDYQPSSVLVKGTDPGQSENGYIGVDPVYQNYANETERPLLAEKGPEKKVESAYVTDDVDTSLGAAEQGENPDGEPDEDPKDDRTQQPSGSGPNVPPAPNTPGS